MIRYFHVDAFAQGPFTGNPAGVCPLTAWLPTEHMQQIAAENNLAETAFIVPRPGSAADYDIRWFTPAVEIDLCGHATLASAHVLFTHLGFAEAAVVFHSQSGPLQVSREADGRLTLDFPSRPPQELAAHPTGLVDGLRATPLHVLASRDLLVTFNTEAEVLALKPDYARIAALEYVGVIATAPGSNGIDFVSRFFAPRVGVPEDPVTGSAHSTLIPYWANRLGKTELRARQISPRGGDLWCRLRNDRVDIGGYAVTYSAGELLINPAAAQDAGITAPVASAGSTPKVTGVGGIFFFADDPKATAAWYNQHLGIESSEWGATFEGRSLDNPEEVTQLQWSPFKRGSEYFAPSKKEFMINYRVQNIEGLVAKLRENGVTVLDNVESSEYGKFVHLLDLDGNKVELWEPN